MKLSNKQIGNLTKRFGKELKGDAVYWAYSTWGVRREDLEEAGFKVTDDGGFYKAKAQHSQDSDVLTFKMWKEDLVMGRIYIEQLIGDDGMTKAKAVHFMYELAKEWHGRWPETERWAGEEHPLRDLNIAFRARSLDWMYKNKTTNWIVCQACFEMGIEK